MVRTILGLEEHDRSPVVAPVLSEVAARASGQGGGIVGVRIHRKVEGVAANNLVKVGCERGSGEDDRVATLDHEL